MKTTRTNMKLTIAAAGLLLSGASMAQSTWSGTWNWAAPCDPATCKVTGPTGTEVTATVSAYGAETAAGYFANAAIYTDTSSNYLGITSAGESTTSPNHAIDNFRKNGATSTCTTCASGGADVAEALLINFTQAVALTQVAVSWTWNDSDALIFRWDGAGAPDLLTTAPASLPITTGSLSSKVGSGWTLVRSDQFSTAGVNSAGSLGFANNVYSSYWLVSTALTSGNDDGFKVSAFTGSVCSGQINSSGQCSSGSNSGGNSGTVSEPGTLALAAAAFVGLTQVRRRKQQKT
jgi:hypothetical protein